MSAPAPTSQPGAAAAAAPAGPAGGGELGTRTTPRPWQRPAPTQAQLRVDAAAALALFAGALLAMALQRAAMLFTDPAHPVLSVVVLAGITLPLALRRRYPASVLVAVSAVFIVAGETMVPETLITNIALFMALYTSGAWISDRRRALILRLVVVDVMAIWLLVSFFRIATDPPDGEQVDIGPGTLSPLAAFMLVQVLINALYFAGAIWFGNHAWKAARDRHLLIERAHDLQAERALVEAQAVTIERMRLARELHDAVAHHVSLMGVQAAAARTLLDRDPGRAGDALERVEDAARDAISELHTLLGTLRAEPDGGVDPGSTDPVGSLGVERIPDLIEDARHGGLQVQYQVIGEPVPMRPLASLNLYRIAQEALTNARKHAGNGAQVDVRLRYLPEAVELEVADDGAGRRRRPVRPGSGGLGLVGMRERVGTDGGTLHVGPRREGGFLVRAQVPLTPTALAADEHRSPDEEQEAPA
ncbi:sensor histidine kinase [Pseudactinotalea sp. Z1739]|uniref:sensor histidine kinase n=1 Tax=Pseudactinotalea sp. Z1739 TaxID=3413028 RepID=UPI003C7A7479